MRAERWAGAGSHGALDGVGSPVAAVRHLDLILGTVDVGKGFEPRRNII